MKVATAGITIALFTTSLCSALPPTKKERVHDVPLSDKDHFINEEHNSDYDHEAFMGKEEAHEYEDLSPEESKERLGKIVDKIDKDNDGFVTEEELIHWIKYVQHKYITDDTSRMWDEHEIELDNTLKWESYRKRTYGYEHEPEDDETSYKDMIDKDKRKWDAADLDKDGKLSKEEFSAFIHPEETEHMKDIVVLETIEDIDKDKDGFISLEEYIADITDNDDEDDDDDDDDEDDKEWRASEEDQFKFYRDMNSDGKLDHNEVKHWIMPDDYDNSEAESKHLIMEADEDKDGQLTKEEILEKYDVFVGSQATEYGEALQRHDEF